MIMNLLNFVSQYPDEASCKAKWKVMRDQEGVLRPRCSLSKQRTLLEKRERKGQVVLGVMADNHLF
jgi:hypothetical protein